MGNPTDDRDIERRGGCGRARCRVPDSSGTVLARSATRRRRRLAQIAAATTAVALACGGCMSVTRRPVMAGPLPPGDPAADGSMRAQGAPEPPTGPIREDASAGADPSADGQPMVMEVCEERQLWPVWVFTGVPGVVLTSVYFAIVLRSDAPAQDDGVGEAITTMIFLAPGLLLDVTALVSGIADVAIKPECHTEPMGVAEM